ncbi:hypothetical protein [Clostridium sp. UBA3887]|uniref:hypothetical protein n=1 Tax=Clostridium TaxID=1485 RepID=UPI0032163C43
MEKLLTKEEREIVVIQLTARCDYFQKEMTEEAKNSNYRRVEEIATFLPKLKSATYKIMDMKCGD